MRLGVLGTMVWDRIDHPDAERVERWGGIAYSLAAAAAALPERWSLRPLVKVGGDLAASADRFVDSLPGVDDSAALVRVPEPNNRVHLRYIDRHHRHECLTGGVPPWRWDELAPLLDGLDALYVNLIAGFELDLDTTRRLRRRFPGLLYADLHSLLLGPPRGAAPRRPRPLERRDEWLDCFDVVQVNDAELALVAGRDEPWAVARDAVQRGVAAVLVTLGPEGATWVALDDRPKPWEDPRRRGTTGPVATPEPVLRNVPVDRPWPRGDPTGCGDVWGATCFIELVRGRPLSEAVTLANRAAARNATHRGADGLYEHLRGGA